MVELSVIIASIMPHGYTMIFTTKGLNYVPGMNSNILSRKTRPVGICFATAPSFNNSANSLTAVVASTPYHRLGSDSPDPVYSTCPLSRRHTSDSRICVPQSMKHPLAFELDSHGTARGCPEHSRLDQIRLLLLCASPFE